MFDFTKLKGRRISVLITGKDNKKESYNGILESVTDGFLMIKTLPSSTFTIDRFLIRTDIVESVWIYKEET